MKQFFTILATVLITALVLIWWSKMFDIWGPWGLFSFGQELDPVMSDDEISAFEKSLLGDSDAEENTQNILARLWNIWTGEDTENNREGSAAWEDISWNWWTTKDDIVICSNKNQIAKADPLTGEIICVDADIVETECVWLDGEAYDLWDTKTQYKTNIRETKNDSLSCEKATFTCVNGLYISTVEDAGAYTRDSCIIVDQFADEITCTYEGDQYLPGETVYKFVSDKVEQTTECRYVWFYCNGDGEWISEIEWGWSIYNQNECVFTQALDNEYIESYASNLIERGLLKESSNWELTINTTITTKESGASCETPRGESVDHGESVLSFEDETGWFEEECVIRTSRCDDGTFVEKVPFQYPSCKIDIPDSCTVGSTKLYHGTTKTFYANGRYVGNQRVCDKQERTCEDGNVTGDNTYTSTVCTPPVQRKAAPAPRQAAAPAPTQAYDASKAVCPSPYVWGWASRKPDQTWIWYYESTVAFGGSCRSVNLVCKFGTIRIWSVWSFWGTIGQKFYQSCNQGEASSCTFQYKDAAAKTLAHGGTQTFYTVASVPFGSKCDDKKATTVCTNGSLSIPSGFANCTSWAPASCTSACGSVNHGASITTYNFSSLPYDPNVRSCSAVGNATVVSTCTNGTLSPAPAANCSCSVESPKNCANGMRHGETITRVNNPWCNADEFGNNLDGWANSACACKFWSITCTNGSLSKTANYPGDGFPVGSCG